VWDVQVREIRKQTVNYPIELKLDIKGGQMLTRFKLENVSRAKLFPRG